MKNRIYECLRWFCPARKVKVLVSRTAQNNVGLRTVRRKTVMFDYLFSVPLFQSDIKSLISFCFYRIRCICITIRYIIYYRYITDLVIYKPANIYFFRPRTSFDAVRKEKYTHNVTWKIRYDNIIIWYGNLQ